MTALTNERMSSQESWQSHLFTLAMGNKAWKNGVCAIDLGTGKVVPGETATGLLVIGKFTETIDATAADAAVNVRLSREIWVDWLVNDTGSPILATDIGAVAYIKDDQTVTKSPAGASIAGRVWAVDALRGVAVELLGEDDVDPTSLSGLDLATGALAGFSSNNINVPNSPVSGSIYELPATSAASTITLPAVADPGTILHFVADGIENAHTVQYRDATGPVNITTALTASKRHMVVAAFLNGVWRANAYVSP